VIHLTQTGLSFKLKADFKVMSFIPTQWTCNTSWPSFLSWYRNVFFNIVVKNIWLVTSPYFQIMINDQNGFLAGWSNSTILAPGEVYTGGAGNILMGGTYRYVTVTIYPIGLGWIPGTPTNPMDYMSRWLDGNPANNIATSRIYLNPCPE
jgi:hypothetical protein